MPTGYTAGITDSMTFSEFALRCARAFGALVMMRDDSMDAPIPQRFEPSDYHSKALEDAKSELAAVREMNDVQCGEKAVECAAKHNERCRQAKADMAKQEAGYRRMLGLVENWTPPTPDHEEMKKFMIQQITDSIKWDCSNDYYIEAAVLSPEAWRTERIGSLECDIEYHTTHYAEEVERTETRNKWVDDLRKSLESARQC